MSVFELNKVLGNEVVVGFKLKFTHDIDGDFSYLHHESYGWEDEDDLEVIYKTVNSEGCEGVIVLNTQPDVLTTAVITNMEFFDISTPKQKAVDEICEICGNNSEKVRYALMTAHRLWL